MDPDKNEALRQSSSMRDAALIVLLERLGGKASYTEADYQAIVAKYGGPSRLSIHVEVVQHDGGPSTVELQLHERQAAQGELVS